MNVDDVYGAADLGAADDVQITTGSDVSNVDGGQTSWLRRR